MRRSEMNYDFFVALKMLSGGVGLAKNMTICHGGRHIRFSGSNRRTWSDERSVHAPLLLLRGREGGGAALPSERRYPLLRAGPAKSANE